MQKIDLKKEAIRGWFLYRSIPCDNVINIFRFLLFMVNLSTSSIYSNTLIYNDVVPLVTSYVCIPFRLDPLPFH